MVEDGPIFLGIDALDDGRLNLDCARHVSEEIFRDWTRRVVPTAGDLVFSYETRIGQAALIPPGLRCCLGRRLGLVRPKSEGLNSRYLLYYYLSPSFQDHLRAHTKPGSTVDRIHLNDFPRFPIAMPPRRHQDEIADLLGSLDDKIELNRRMAETLEAMARALFKSWFEASGEAGSVVVQSWIDSGILQIGDGYRAKNDELAAPGLPFLRAADINGGIDTATADTLSQASVSKAGSKVSRPGDVAFTSKGTVGRFARVDDRTLKFVYSPQVCFWRSLDPVRLHPALLYLMMRSPAFRAQIDTAAGQTDMAPYVSLQDQRRMVLPTLPPDQGRFGEQLQAFLSQQAGLRDESRTIATLRDTLLPKLISSQLAIADAEVQVSAA
jgi:type I restriction enzyme, S subunit